MMVMVPIINWLSLSIDVKKLHHLTGEANKEDEYYDYVDVFCILETNKDLTFAQYLFTDSHVDGNWFVHNEITLQELEKLLNALEENHSLG